jgi:predicted nuclease of predicted toxin-antitoxin system
MILADENIDYRIVKTLRKSGIDTYSVSEKHSGIIDEEVIDLARELKRIILTEDKDLGEWVFAHDVKDTGVVFLRYHYSDYKIITELLIKLLNDKQEELFNKFTTITKKKIRIRAL